MQSRHVYQVQHWPDGQWSREHNWKKVEAGSEKEAAELDRLGVGWDALVAVLVRKDKGQRRELLEASVSKNWTTDQVVKKLKGPKGTTVNISISRPGYDKLIDMNVERDEVNIVTVRGAFMIDNQTGYVKLG